METQSLEEVKALIKKHWGFDGFLPLQQEAMGRVLAGRDSIVVLPTGGGKSLCFQAPAVAMPGLAVAVSPLISLMKDQVDALAECGVPAARLDSSQTPGEQNAVWRQLRDGALKLLYVSPERLVSKDFLGVLKSLHVSFIAIDEAHCVSMWGHDFRPEYRQLEILKQAFPGVAVHAYTATATEPVRRDIAQQLALADPQMLVGSYDRPNLIYKVARRTDRLGQVCSVLSRHRGESCIVYCIRRRDVDDLCAALVAKGYKAAPYHAGMENKERAKNQEAFIEEKADIIVATVAFGMGIDKSNVRAVIHAGMPKSLEHYQQETGRAGRDGLPAECCLFFSNEDYQTWRRLLGNLQEEPKAAALAKLERMLDYCGGVKCRHQAISNYFGQTLEKANCGACDVCMGAMDRRDDALIIAQKILSCVARLKEHYGANYTALVLIGDASDERIETNGHDNLSTYGILKSETKRAVRDWIEQLVSQGCLDKAGEYGVLKITEKGWRAIKGQETPVLLKAAARRERVKAARVESDSWEGVDRSLFEVLRKLRRQVAESKGLPPFVIFHDTTLRDMALLKPTTPDDFLLVNGVGEHKRSQYGAVFLGAIKQYLAGESPNA